MFVWAEREQGAKVGCNVPVFDSSAEGLSVRFSMAMRCAERPGMFTMLWQHEFYMVMEVTYGAYMYQAST